MIETLATIAFLGAMATAAFTDLTRYEIPNWISLVVAAAFVVSAIGDTVGVECSPSDVVIFDKQTGLALSLTE